MTSQQNDYKEIPCRRCGRVWKWAFDKKSAPHCPTGYGCSVEEPTVQDMFDEVIKRLDDIEMKINRIPPVQPVYPTTPTAPSLGPTICSKCGMKWGGAMGYNCYLSDCPVQLKVTSQTYNVSYTTGSFDIESLDPAERTWYYDGDGNKRKKE
jgi:hypothetical protein